MKELLWNANAVVLSVHEGLKHRRKNEQHPIQRKQKYEQHLLRTIHIIVNIFRARLTVATPHAFLPATILQIEK